MRRPGLKEVSMGYSATWHLTSLSVSLSFSLSLLLCLCFSLCLCLCLSLCPSLSVYLNVSLSVSVSPSLSLSVSVCLSLSLSVSLRPAVDQILQSLTSLNRPHAGGANAFFLIEYYINPLNNLYLCLIFLIPLPSVARLFIQQFPKRSHT